MKSNPLSTRFVAPGKLPWVSPPDQSLSLSALAVRFVTQLHSRAVIVGPHGSGKSTLLEHLVPLLGSVTLRASSHQTSHFEHHVDERPGSDATLGSSEGVLGSLSTRRKIVWLQLRGPLSACRLVCHTLRHWAQADRLLILDGYEQLPAATRAMALAITNTAGTGMLVTSHRKTWLPSLITTSVNVELARSLLNRLLPANLARREEYLEPKRLDEQLSRHQGNLREVFMELYDEL